MLNALELDLWAYFVECPNQKCRERIPLPRQSPLGKLEGQGCQPKDRWPAEFLCLRCGRAFSRPGPQQGSMLALLIEHSSLLRVPYRYGLGNSEVHKEIYTGFSSLFPQDDALRKVREHVQETYGGEMGKPECYPW